MCSLFVQEDQLCRPWSSWQLPVADWYLVEESCLLPSWEAPTDPDSIYCFFFRPSWLCSTAPDKDRLSSAASGSIDLVWNNLLSDSLGMYGIYLARLLIQIICEKIGILNPQGLKWSINIRHIVHTTESNLQKARHTSLDMGDKFWNTSGAVSGARGMSGRNCFNYFEAQTKLAQQFGSHRPIYHDPKYKLL